MPKVFAAAFLTFMPAVSANAMPGLTLQQAMADAANDGFTRIARAEPDRGNWDLWASKDGLAYEIELDGSTGALLKQTPLESDD